MKKLIWIFVVIFSQNAFSDTKASTEGLITEISVYLESHSDTSARGLAQVKMNTPLESPCDGLYLSQSETVAMSTILAAKAAGTTVKAYYFKNQGAPWNSNICSLYTVLSK